MTDETTEKNAQWRMIRRFLPYLWPKGQAELKVRVVFAIFFLLGAKAITVFTPFLYKYAIDGLSGEAEKTLSVIIGLIVAYGLARFGAILFGELRDAIFVKVGQNALRTIALEVFQHIHRLSLRFHLERRMGGLARSIERGTRGIDFLLRFMLFSILPTIVEIFLVSGIFYVNFGGWFLVILLASVIGYIALTLLMTEWRLKFRRDMNQQDNVANTKAVDSLLNFETVKYFGNEEHESGRYDVALRRYRDAAVKSQSSLALLNAAQSLTINLGLVGIMVLATVGYVDGRLTIGDFVLVNTLLIQLFIPLNFLGFVYREIKQSLVDMEYMFDLMDREAEIKDKPDAPDLQIGGGEIIFDNVSFFYEERRQILKDISFTVPAGKTVAVVGPSGAGKSTLSRILYRFYDIAAGKVTIDGQDIRDVTQRSLRAVIGIVPQDTVLFNDTIRYNIQYGDPAAGMDQIAGAAKLARIDDFIAKLPDGYDAMVGERGLKLSGGEKQRVAIARTILKNPAILLLDEATSALDTQTEREIQDSLKNLTKNRTTLVIAHRLSTIIDADEILVLEDGKITERGRHDALLARGGIYAAMWARQQEAALAQEKLAELQKDP